MIRLMKADTYRLLRTKGFYITLIGTILFSITNVWSQSIGSVGVSTSTGKDILQTSNLHWNLKLAVQFSTFSSAFLVYFLIGIFVILFGYEFTQKTYKNSLTSGVSRLTFIISKYLIQVLAFTFISLAFYTSAIVTAYVKYGIGTTKMGPFIWETLLLAVGASLLISVVFSLAAILLTATQSTVISAVFIVIYPLCIQLLSLMTKADFLKYFDFFGTVQLIGLGEIKGTDLIPYITVSFLTILISLISSTLIIRNKEL